MIPLDSLRLEPGHAVDTRLNPSSPHPTSEPERMRVHRQHVLRINGTLLTNASAGMSLQVSQVIRGALWRTSVHRLCSALDPDPQREWRDCAALGTGPFSAAVFVLVPGTRPRYRPQRRKAPPALTGRSIRWLRSSAPRVDRQEHERDGRVREA